MTLPVWRSYGGEVEVLLEDLQVSKSLVLLLVWALPEYLVTFRKNIRVYFAGKPVTPLRAMAPLLVIGYDQTMLEGPKKSDLKYEEEPRKDTAGLQSDESSKCCALLALPFELRRAIYEYLLPKTVETGHKGSVWVRGHTAIMAANKQIQAETTAIMYGSNTFLLDIEWLCTTFAYQWFLPTGLVPKRTLVFDQLAYRGMALIRKLHVRVHHVDSYTGMVKYNYSGQGLTDGVRDQVSALCTFLRNLPEITKLTIELRDGSATIGLGQGVLEPFLTLKNTREVTVSGTITPDYAEHISCRLHDAYTRNSFLRFPREIRDMIYRQLFASNVRSVFSIFGTLIRHEYLHRTNRDVGLRPRDWSMIYTCRLVHAEATSVLYQSRYFYIFCSQSGREFGKIPIPNQAGFARPIWGGFAVPIHGHSYEFELPMPASQKHKFFNTRHLFFYPQYSLRPHGKGLSSQLKEQCTLFGKLLQEHPRIGTLTIDFNNFCTKAPREVRASGVREVLTELLKVRGVGEVRILHVEDDIAEFFKVLEAREYEETQHEPKDIKNRSSITSTT